MKKALQRHLQLGIVLFTILASLGVLAPATRAEGEATPAATEQDEGDGKAGGDEHLQTLATAEPTAIPSEQPLPTEDPGQTPTPVPTLVSPLPPVIVDATCVDGVFTAGYLSFPPTDGVLYPNETQLDPNTTYYFTVRLETGYAWNLPLPAGWNLDSDGNAVFRLETGPPPECTAVQLPVPVIVQPRCENGTLILGSITIPPTTGLILPDVDEMELFPDLTVRIVARVEPFYEIALPLTDGWAVNAQNELEFSFVTDTVECERPGAAEPTVPPSVPPASESPGKPSATTAPATDTTITALPVTGAPSTPGQGVGSLLLVLGSLAVCATAFELRKRRI